MVWVAMAARARSLTETKDAGNAYIPDFIEQPVEYSVFRHAERHARLPADSMAESCRILGAGQTEFLDWRNEKAMDGFSTNN
jgi:hypothetical protein